MATSEIISSSGEYHSVAVEFDGLRFEQTILSKLTGKALEKFVQSYAEEYEAAYVAPVAPTED